MMRAVVLALFIALASTPGRLAAAESPATDRHEDAVTNLGRGYFLSYCASCHGADARGDGPVAPALANKPSDLTRIAARRDDRFPVDDLVAYVAGRSAPAAHGTREMPVWGTRFVEAVADGDATRLIAHGQLRSILLYLRSVQR